MEAGLYEYAHSCVTSENFPARRFAATRIREIILLEFDHDVTSDEAIAEAVRLGLERPTYEDALYFGIEYPDVQRERPVIFLHDPWFGFFGRRDVLCLWSNAGRRELGLEGFDDPWNPNYRFAFVRGADQPAREPSMMKFDHLTIPVADVNRSRAWYVGTLGLKIEFEVPDRQTVALQDRDGFTVFLQQAPSAVQPNGCALYFQVADVESTFVDWSRRGTDFAHAPGKNYWGYGAELRDPDGYLIRLWDERSMKEK